MDGIEHASGSASGGPRGGAGCFRQERRVLMFISIELRYDREFMFTAIAGNGGLALSDASEALQNDKDIKLPSTQNGLALEYASDALREDREVVLAVRGNGWALQYASDSLRADPEVSDSSGAQWIWPFTSISRNA